MATLTHNNALLGSNSAFDSVTRLPGALAQRYTAWSAARREVARIERELNCYSDRELLELGLFRGDIPAIARGTYRR